MDIHFPEDGYEATIALAALTRDPAFYVRVMPPRMQQQAVAHYRSLYADGKDLGPLAVVKEIDEAGMPTGRLLLADGFLRVEALLQLRRAEATCMGFVRKTHVSVEPIDEAALEELMQLTDNSEGDGLEHQQPSSIGVDNGKQFRNLRFLEKSGITLVRSFRNHPRGRGKVERMFHDINQLLPTMDVPSKVSSTTMTWGEFRAVLDACIRQNNARHARTDDQADMEAEA